MKAGNARCRSAIRRDWFPGGKRPRWTASRTADFAPPAAQLGRIAVDGSAPRCDGHQDVGAADVGLRRLLDRFRLIPDPADPGNEPSLDLYTDEGERRREALAFVAAAAEDGRSLA